MTETVIFCSAPGDIKYALALREQKPCTPCRIVVLRHRELASFLRALSLPGGTEVVFIPAPKGTIGIYKIWKNFRIRRYLDAMKREFFEHTADASVFFFAPYIDWQLFSILSMLAARNTLFYVNYLPPPEASPPVLSLLRSIMLLWMRWATRADIVFRMYNNCMVPAWTYQGRAVSIEAPDYEAVTTKYAYRPEGPPAGQPRILLFPGCEHLTTNLREVTEDLAQRIRKHNCVLLVKPHPRLGMPDWLDRLQLQKLPQFVPSEFLDYNSFVGIIGFESAGLAHAARQYRLPCISLLHLLRYHAPTAASFYEEWLANAGDGRVLFPRSVNDLEALVASMDRVQDEE